MQDRPHVAKVTGEYLDEVGIMRFDWPALCPDLNPNEHVWNEEHASSKKCSGAETIAVCKNENT